MCVHYAQNLGVSKIIFKLIIKIKIKNQYKNNKDIYNVTKYLYISSKCFPLNRLFIKESWKTKGIKNYYDIFLLCTKSVRTAEIQLCHQINKLHFKI